MVTDMQVRQHDHLAVLGSLGRDVFRWVAELDASRAGESLVPSAIQLAERAPRTYKVITRATRAYSTAHPKTQPLAGPLAVAYRNGVTAGVHLDVVWTDEPFSPRGEPVQSPS